MKYGKGHLLRLIALLIGLCLILNTTGIYASEEENPDSQELIQETEEAETNTDQDEFSSEDEVSEETSEITEEEVTESAEQEPESSEEEVIEDSEDSTSESDTPAQEETDVTEPAETTDEEGNIPSEASQSAEAADAVTEEETDEVPDITEPEEGSKEEEESANLRAAAATAPTMLWVEPTETNGIPSQIDVFKAKTGGTTYNPTYTYQLYLPGNVNLSNIFLSWDGGATATVDNVTYESGACPIPPRDTEKSYVFKNGSSTLATLKIITYQGSSSVPPVFIVVDESNGNPTIAQMDGDPDHNVTCTGQININGTWYVMSKIKGRGNVTWDQASDKRPYNITLDTKINFPGIDCEKTKKWTFMAEILDHSLLCNRAGFHLAYEMGIGQDTNSADVWMNGEYQGCYMVTPKTDSYVPKTGFMIEQDNYLEPSVANGGDPQFKLDGLNEASGWSSAYNRITVKKMGDTLINNDESPENLEAVANNVLKPWLQDAWDAIRSDTGYNSKGKYYTEYIDIESFAKMYLMHEFVKSYDVCAGSILYHRDGQTDADKLIAGPLWDLDNALGATFQNSSLGRADDRRNGDRRSAEGDFIPNITEYKTSVYKTISKHEDFMAEVYRQYNLHRDQFDSIANDTQQMIDSIEASARMNHIKVDDLRNNNHKYSSAASFGSGQYKQNYLATTNSKTDWGNYVANLKTFITIRSLWFHNHYYDPDFVDPSTCEHQYETVTVPATCTSTGSVTYTCPICKDSYVEELPIIAHDYQDGVCSVCGQILLTADIICGSGATVTVYETQDTSGASEENASSTHPRNSSTGLIDCSGDGQINFVINVKDGYELVDVTIEPRSSYKNLKGPDDTGIENGYRLTKVSGNLTITVQTHKISVTAPKISAHRLLLSSEIGVQFKLELPKDFDAAGSYMDFAVSDGRNFTMPVSEAEKVPGENTYWFTCYMNALELADTINATYHYGTDGVRSDRFSAMDYIESSRQIYPEMTNLLALMDALQDYGHYLQLSGWTDNHTHVPIAAVSTLDQDSIAEAKAVVSQMGVEKNLANSGITDAMFSLTLNSKTTINVFVRPGENVSITGSNAAANGTKEINGATYYQFSTEPIGALHLDQVYTVTVTTTAGTAVIQGSAMSYVDAVLGNSSFNMDQQLAMAAFYRYYAAAKAY